ncbi:ExbD/TolR family protein [Pseudoalteromonas xiamenensis]|jgi:biopolymer transport protein ExbD|uniref:Biopolymer transporter ExbD n=1 Tax=Pseudoalteromonas xiamenensis TaxID=882626 RepID=A0A975DG79_9GAMM|nr:biopolymer transporter ExbD [Pseudoalteromonas xiamenensis]QTH71263.1 biopolymer transporter ExbD [Pseudoalteromonas xiamenensis]
MQSRLQHRLESQDKGIDMSPLIDVVFILLIFFIVTTVFVRETGVEVDKPQSMTASQIPSRVILLGITAQGQVFYDGANIGVAGVRATLQPLLTQDDKPVLLQVDKTVPTSLLVQVMDEAKLAGAAAVSIATKQ